MNRIRINVLASVGLLLSFTSQAFAQEKVCLIEGILPLGDEKIETKNCLQNNGVPQAQFTKICDVLSGTAATDDVPPAKITYMATCPSQSQGSCEGFLGRPMTNYYYKHDVESLPTIKAICQSQGGKWK